MNTGHARSYCTLGVSVSAVCLLDINPGFAARLSRGCAISTCVLLVGNYETTLVCV